MIVMRGHSGAVYGVKFTADINFMLSASEDTTGYYDNTKTWLSFRRIVSLCLKFSLCVCVYLHACMRAYLHS